MKKRLLAILLALVMVFSIAEPVLAAGLPTPSSTDPLPETSDIRVMSWNVLNTPGSGYPGWAEHFTSNIRAERTVEIISRYDADSIGFQECLITWKNLLGAALTDYTMVEAHRGSSDPVFYRQDRMELLDAGVFWLSETPDVPSKASSAEEERVCTWAILRNKETDVKYAHFNTHLDHVSDEARVLGMQVIRSKLETFRTEVGDPNLGFVVTGDFNLNRTAPGYGELIGQSDNINVQDSLYCAPQDKVINEGMTLPDLKRSEDMSIYDNGLAIDHCFVSIDKLDVRSYKVVRDGDKDDPTLGPSDHFPLYIELNVGPGEVRRTDDPNAGKLMGAFGDVVIDGVKDEIYASSGSGKVDVSHADSGNTPVPSDELTSATYTFAHDEDYLYYFIDVKDAHVTDASIKRDDNSIDRVEIYYNFLLGEENPPTSFTSAICDLGEAGYFRVYANGDTPSLHWTSSPIGSKLSYTAVHTDTGYVLEGRIPLSASAKVKLTGSEPLKVGFGILINDDTNNGVGDRDYFITHDNSGSIWGNPNNASPLYLAPSVGGSVPNNAVFGTPTIDGDMDELFADAYEGSISKIVTAPPAGENTASTATYRFAFDASYLYYFIDVKDSTVTPKEKSLANTDKQLEDGVEFYVNYTKTNSYSWAGEAFYFNLFASGKPFVSSWAPISITDGMTYAAKYTDTGYALEGRIPLCDAIKNSLSGASEPIGMAVNFMVIDDVDGCQGERDGLTVYNDSALSAWSTDYAHKIDAPVYLVPPKQQLVIGGAIKDTDTQRAPYGAATIDGTMDAAFLGATADNFHHNGKYPQNTDTNAVYRFLHDDNYLYYFIDVTDANVSALETENHPDHASDKNGIDGVQLYYDFLNTDGYMENVAAYTWATCNENGKNAGYFGMFANGNHIHVEQGSADGIEYVAKHTETGYVLEGKVPLGPAVKERLAGGSDTTIGFGLQLNDDSDNDGQRDNYLMSQQEILSAWSQPYNMTDMILEGSGNRSAVSGTAEIDGLMDEAYQYASTVLVNKDYQNQIVTHGGATAAAKFLYDNDYLYVFTEVTDAATNTPLNPPGSTNYGVDSIQFYMDLTGDLTNPYWRDGCGYLILSVNGVEFWTDNLRNTYGTDDNLCSYAIVRTNEGYNMELRFALTDSVKTKLANDGTADIKFGLQLNDDSDFDSERNHWSFTDGSLNSAWQNGAADIQVLTLAKQYQITTDLTADQATLTMNTGNVGQTVTPNLVVAEGMMLVEGSVKLDGEPYELGTPIIMPAHDMVLTAQIVPKPAEYPIILPEIEGLTIAAKVDGQVVTSAAPGATVELDIQLAPGYDFGQTSGTYDYGHFSNSQQKWVYFTSSPYGLYLMGRRLKVNAVSIPYSGNTFTMPDGKAEITAELEKHPVYTAPNGQVVLDGNRDALYDLGQSIDLNRSVTSEKTYLPSGDRAVGVIYTAYDGEYLYCLAEIDDRTVNTSAAPTSDVTMPKSLLGYDQVVFFIDFLNSDTHNMSNLDYTFVNGESGIFATDALMLEAASDGTVYDKLGGGFASYNGNKDKADYTVVRTETGYNIEMKIALSDSFKQKLATGGNTDIGFGAILVDDRDNNGGWDYGGSDKALCTSPIVTNLWANMTYNRTSNNHLQVTTDASPRWLSDLTLDAPKNLTVTLDPNGGTVEPESVTVTQGQPFGTLPTPTFDGYTFTGWFDAENVKILPETMCLAASDFTLTAQWTANPYVITLNPDGGTLETTSVNVTFGQAVGTLPVPTKEGYTFEGWFDAEGNEYAADTIYNVADDLTLTAQWSPNQYTVTLNPNGGLVNPSSIIATYDQVLGQLPVPTRVGYEFTGWVDDQGQPYTEETVYTTLGDITLTATWRIVLFDLSGANLKLGEDITMFFYVDTANLAGTDYYLTITRSFNDGETPDDVQNIPYEQWMAYGSGTLKRVAYPNIAACQMNESISVVVYDNAGQQVSNVWTDSIKTYAMRMLDKDDTAALTKTLLVDLLNYGAAAQTFFEYDTEALVNAGLTPDDQALASATPALRNQQVSGENFAGSTLVLRNKIQLTLYFENLDTSMHAAVTYIDFNGNVQSFTVEGSDFVERGQLMGVRIDSMMMAEYNVPVIVKVYDTEGNEVASACDSVESYLARNLQNDPLYAATAKALSSALAYANSNK